MKIVRDLKELGPDHVVITGDLVNISLPSEFQRAATWLRAVGPHEDVSVIPGNHDAYVSVPYVQSWRHWAPYMIADHHSGETLNFPFVRRRAEVAIVGLSTAIPTGIGMAYGRLGDAQCTALRSVLLSLEQEGLFRVVLLHHPPFDNAATIERDLKDAAMFRDVIAGAGAELILHGHNHRYEFANLAGPKGPIPVVGSPSTSVTHGHGIDAAQYLIYNIEHLVDAWQLKIRRRYMKLETRDFAEETLGSLVVSPSFDRTG